MKGWWRMYSHPDDVEGKVFDEYATPYPEVTDPGESLVALIITAVVVVAIILLVVFWPGMAHAAGIDSSFKVRAVDSAIGEAEGEGLEGMRAVISCLRNRAKVMHDPFKHVYGERSRRVLKHLYGAKTFVLAVRAYEESAFKDYSNGAQGWGNVKDVAEFEKHKWWRRCVIVARIGHHIFYREMTQEERINQYLMDRDIDRGL